MEKEIFNQILNAGRIVITAHKSADGDSVGSSTALYHICQQLNKEVHICFPDRIPSFLNWVKGTDEIVYFDEEREKVIQLMTTCDLLFALDYNESSRIGNEMGNVFIESKAYKIMIDHHTFPGDFVDIKYSFPKVCSTCQLIYEVLDQSQQNQLLNIDVATSIYLGIMTDTGSFRFPSVTERTHEIAAHLLKAGIQHYRIHEQVYDANTLDRIQLQGYTFSNKLNILNQEIAILSLTQEELQRYHYKKGDTEGFVNIALSIQGIKIAAFFHESDGIIKISFRSKGTNNQVNLLSKAYFNGGGHVNAAGGRFNGNIENAIALFKEKVYEFLDQE